MKNNEERFLEIINQPQQVENHVKELKFLQQQGVDIDVIISGENALTHLNPRKLVPRQRILLTQTIYDALRGLDNFEDSAYYWVISSILHTRTTHPTRRKNNIAYHQQQEFI